jgi:hypothetical protein
VVARAVSSNSSESSTCGAISSVSRAFAIRSTISRSTARCSSSITLVRPVDGSVRDQRRVLGLARAIERERTRSGGPPCGRRRVRVRQSRHLGDPALGGAPRCARRRVRAVSARDGGGLDRRRLRARERSGRCRQSARRARPRQRDRLHVWSVAGEDAACRNRRDARPEDAVARAADEPRPRRDGGAGDEVERAGGGGRRAAAGAEPGVQAGAGSPARSRLPVAADEHLGGRDGTRTDAALAYHPPDRTRPGGGRRGPPASCSPRAGR